jgi:hypothetical protein
MRIFLSYQTRDLDPAERLAQGLHRERPDLTVFVAPRALAAGAYWLPRLADELARADAVLFLVGQRIGPWQELEYYEAQRLSRQAGRNGWPLIVPVLMVEQGLLQRLALGVYGLMEEVWSVNIMTSAV